MSPKSADSKRRPAPAGPVLAGQHRLGLALALVTAVGWGLNWPTMKFLLSEWPPLFARGLSGLVAATALATIAAVRGERLAVPQRLWPRLAAASFTNVFAWMGFTTVAMRWLDAGESALLVYTMPIWALMFAWPFQGRRPDGASLLALALGMGGVAILFAPGAAGPVAAFSGERGLGIALLLAAAVSFALGTVAWRTPLALPALTSTAWQVGLGCLPMLVLGLLLERDEIGPLSTLGVAAMAYMTVIPMAICYLSWFAALRRVSGTTASMATLLVPVIGVMSAAALLGEPFGPRQWLALVLTLSGVALAVRQR